MHLRQAGFDDPRWLTYNQAQTLEAQVRKGEAGRTVQYVKQGEMRDVVDDSGNLVLDENGENQRQFVKYDKPKVFSARVFNAEQMDNMPPLPSLDERIEAVSCDINERAENVLQLSGADIRHRDGDRAYYNPKDDYIMLPEREQFNDDAVFYATALHELGHWTGHESRLDRDLSHPFGSAGYAKEELRAEISSFMNAQRYGVPHDPSQNAAYVGSWIKSLDDDPKEIIHASSQAMEISNFIGQFDRGLKQTQEQTIEEQQMQAQTEKIWLNVPFDEKDQAKTLGAQWDGKQKSWYAPAEINLEPLQKWINQQVTNESTQAASIKQLTEKTFLIETGNEEYPFNVQIWVNKAYVGIGKFCTDEESVMTYLKSEGFTEHDIEHTMSKNNTYLAVPYSEKDDAKALGAQWDKKAKSWFAPKEIDIKLLEKWLPEKKTQTDQSLGSDPVREFSHALQAAGLDVKNIQADGELHRVPIQGKPDGKDGAYKLHLDGIPAGFIQNFVTGHKENWVGGKQELTQEQLAVQQAKLAAQRAEREQKRELLQKENAKKATDEFQQLPKATPDHPYLAKKGLSQDIIDKMDLRIDKEGRLVVPVKNNNDEIQTLQRIGGNGFKQFESGCKAQGGFNIIGENALKAQDKNEPVIISTGVATAASIHMATGEPVVVAFQDSNLKAVAEEFKAMYPYRSVFVAGDNDQHNVSNGLKNSGLVSAKAAAKAVGGKYGVPKFAANQQGKQFSDFSDLHRVAGLAAVKRQIRTGLSVARANVNEDKQREQAIDNSKERVQERTEKQKEVRQQKQEEKQQKRRSRSL